MERADVPAVERIIADTINETARGDPDDLAARIVAAFLPQLCRATRRAKTFVYKENSAEVLLG